MTVKEKIYEIIEEYDGSGDIDECVGDIREYLDKNTTVKAYDIHTDTDVFDSCGLDIFYISVGWIDEYGDVNVCGDRLTSC